MYIHIMRLHEARAMLASSCAEKLVINTYYW